MATYLRSPFCNNLVEDSKWSNLPTIDNLAHSGNVQKGGYLGQKPQCGTNFEKHPPPPPREHSVMVLALIHGP